MGPRWPRPSPGHYRKRRWILPRPTMGAPSGGTCHRSVIRMKHETRRPFMGTRDVKLDLLLTVPLFADLSRKDIESVGRLADTVDVPAGKVLMREGESGAEMFVIASGSVVVERGGREVVRLGKGDVVGEGALLSEGPRTATVTTAEPSTLFVLGHREFH